MEVVEDINSLTLNCPTEVSKTSDSSIVVRATLLLVPLSSKVELQFHVAANTGVNGLEILVDPQASVVYGERFNEKKMSEFLHSRVGVSGSSPQEKDGKGKQSWSEAVAELEERLLARGKK